MKKRTLLLCTLLLIACADKPADAGTVEPAFAYQGRLLGKDGMPPSSPLPLVVSFCLYGKATGGNPVWGRAVPVKVNTKGNFYTELSDSVGNPISNASYKNLADALAGTGSSDIWIGLTIAGMTEISPRQRISAVPYAGHVEVADHADVGTAHKFYADSVTVRNEFAIQNLSASVFYPHGDLYFYSDQSDITISPASRALLTYGFKGILMNYSPPANRGHDISNTDQLTVRYNYENSVPYSYFALPVLKGETIYPEGTAVLETSLGSIK